MANAMLQVATIRLRRFISAKAEGVFVVASSTVAVAASRKLAGSVTKIFLLLLFILLVGEGRFSGTDSPNELPEPLRGTESPNLTLSVPVSSSNRDTGWLASPSSLFLPLLGPSCWLYNRCRCCCCCCRILLELLDAVGKPDTTTIPAEDVDAIKEQAAAAAAMDVFLRKDIVENVRLRIEKEDGIVSSLDSEMN